MKVTIKDVTVDKLVEASFNPAKRTSDTALRSLRKLIVEYGGIARPLDVVLDPRTDMYAIADGHRRFAIARSEGYPTVPVAVHHGWSLDQLPELWSLLNKNKGISGQEWAEAWFASPKIKLPPPVKSNVDNMIRIWGKREAQDLVVNKGVNPSVVHCLAQVRVRFEQVPTAAEVVLGRQFTEKEIGTWLISCRMQNAVNSMFNGTRVSATTMRRVARCIKNNEQYRLE